MEKDTEIAVEEQELLPETPSANERWKAGIRSKHPDRSFENDDDFYQASMEGYDAEHEKVKSMAQANKSLADKMASDPKAAAALAEFMEGKPLPVALKKYFTDEELSMAEGEEGYEDYLQAVKERTERDASNKAMQAEYEANLEASAETTREFATEKGMSDEQFDQFMETAISKLIEPLLKGNVSREMLDILFKGMNYESDLAVTADTNYKRGKNEKIIESKKALKTDGLPDTSKGAGAASTSKPLDPTAKAFDQMVSRSASEDIYARGGFTRKQRS